MAARHENDTMGAAPALEPGLVLQGTYRIVRRLAAGGMGQLYLAAHERLPGRFAIKVLHRDCVRDAETLARFRSEAEIMSELHHPHIAQVLDFNTTPDGTPYLVMELVEGRDLGEVLKDGVALPPMRVAAIVHQIASALDAAHARGIIHRDLKPENVMVLSLDGEEFVKVVDFGISLARGSQRITAQSTVVGTPQFMSPEQAQGHRDQIDERSDQFALAAMAYSLLTGQEPFRGDNAVTILYQVVHQQPTPLVSLVPWPCAHVDAVLARGMAKRREHRFGSVMELARALDAAVLTDAGLAPPDGVTLPVRTASGAARAETPRSVVVDDEDASRLVTLRVRPPRARRTVQRIGAGVTSAACAIALLLYLHYAGWGTVTSALDVAVEQASTATARAVARWRAVDPAVAAPPPGLEAAPVEHRGPVFDAGVAATVEIEPSLGVP